MEWRGRILCIQSKLVGLFESELFCESLLRGIIMMDQDINSIVVVTKLLMFVSKISLLFIHMHFIKDILILINCIRLIFG